MAESNDRSRRMGISGHYAVHGSSVLKIGLVSVLGVLATFGFQVLTARFLGPADFSVLAAFLAIVSMAAIGSSALQNSVAVQVSRAQAHGPVQKNGRRRLQAPTVEALVLGGGGAIVLVAAASPIALALDTETFVALFAAISVLLSFLFARSLGVIQGVGDSEGAVWWTSISLVLRLILVLVAFALGLGLPGVVGAVLFGALVSMIGATVQAQRTGVHVLGRVFRRRGVIVLLLTILFAVLTNVDVLLVRGALTAEEAGTYAGAALIVKAGFLIPATLSLYLLPRFVRQSSDRALTRLGVRVTIAVTAGGGLFMIVALAVAGESLSSALLGPSYMITGPLLLGLGVAYLPWVVAQGLLIRMSALSSSAALAALFVALILMLAIGFLVLPDVGLLLVTIGATGAAVLTVFAVIDIADSRSVVAELAPEDMEL